MSKIQDETRTGQVRSGAATVGSTHIPPPATSALKGGNANTKARTLKAITESLFITDKQRHEANKQDNGFWKTNRMNYFEYLFYKILLVGLYIVYGFFRYGEYQYNKMRLRIYNIIYNPSNTPQLIRQDVIKLAKIPKRLAAILEVKPVGDVGGGLKGLLNDGSKMVCWTVSAGIKHLTLYDYDGVLQKNVQDFRNEIHVKLAKYYGPSNVPKYAIRIPHSNKVFYNKDDVTEHITKEDKKVAIEISLLSIRDGRETIVDLTKTMADLCKSNDLKVSDITIQLVDSELTQLVGPEPDLLLYFGPSLDLQGFPPWHIRLTEFYWDQDNNEVTYSVFIRGLREYAGCKMNVGK